MFDIISIKLKNFRSYIGEHEFTFPQKPGLYSLTGINKLNPRLGANDTGKTTLLEAIFWCFYGRTTRGLRGGDVVSWGQKGCTISVDCNIGGCNFNITRTQSPNSLVLGGNAVVQATIDQQLRLGSEQFLYSVMMPQFGDSFFDLAAAEKLNLFSQIMGLDYWLEKSKEAGELAADLLKQISILNQTKGRYEGNLEMGTALIKQYQERSATFENSQRQAIKGLKSAIRATQKKSEGFKRAMKQDQEALASLLRRIETASTKCPTCKQPLNTDHLKTLKQNQSDFRADLSRQERFFSTNEAEWEAYEQRIEEESQRENPYDDLLKTQLLEIDSLQRKIGELTAEIDSTISDHAAVDFWVGGFKRLRLYVVETTLRQLEIEVNNGLTDLGLVDWKVTFDIERETKSGGITRGFTVLITPPLRLWPIRWESFSGGATQRLRLAGNLGLANLIMERAGLESKCEFFDEPTAHLSASGIHDLLNTLECRARDLSKKIWIIDHHSLDYAFDGQVTVIKDENGSSLSYSSN